MQEKEKPIYLKTSTFHLTKAHIHIHTPIFTDHSSTNRPASANLF